VRLLRPWNGRLGYILWAFGILRPFGVSNGLLVLFVVSLVYIFIFGLLYQEKSGNPGRSGYTKKVLKPVT
jgi:hypothetical protein